MAINISQAGLPDVRPGMSNGATFDPETGNVEGTALANAARTATANSADITNVNCRGLSVWLNVLLASGTGGLTVRVQAKDPTSGQYYPINTAPAAIITTGIFLHAVYPGAAGGALTQTTGQPVPRTFRVQVTHGDASSYTYSVGYCLLR